MSGRSPYANGYGYPSDSGRSENGGYGSSSSLGVNGYGGSNAGGGGGNRERDRERRPGGYGGFMSEEPQRPPTASSTVSRERDRDREYDRGRGDQDRRPSAASSSRSRPRDANTGTRWKPGRDEGDYMRSMPTNRPEAAAGGGRGAQSIEGRYGAPIIRAFILTFFRGAANDPTKLGLYGYG